VALSGHPDTVLITNLVGEFAFLSRREFAAFMSGRLEPATPLFRALQARSFLCDPSDGPFLSGLVSQWRTRKAMLLEGRSLHIFVVTIRCDHRCHYCQVTPQHVRSPGFDMSEEVALAAVDKAMTSRPDRLTIEFQSGEPCVVFPLIERVVRAATNRANAAGKTVNFVLASTLINMTDAMLDFCRSNSIQLSTSLDGPQELHDRQRIKQPRGSFRQFTEALARARAACGPDSVSALATITRHSLDRAEDIVSTYRDLGFHSISLRPVSPLGFAVRANSRLGYTSHEYLQFLGRALEHLVRVNLEGHYLEETYLAIVLQRILTPFATNYVDLESPCAAGRAVVVYNYDGSVYPSDEARMLAEMGDRRFRMGSIFDSWERLDASSAMELIGSVGPAERLPGCEHCAFVPYCGVDPVMNVAWDGRLQTDVPSGDFCTRQTGIFNLLFGLIREGRADVLRVLLSWLTKRSIEEVPEVGYVS
jgi:His-Xaa-Ser system radical SAM maturase HxsB